MVDDNQTVRVTVRGRGRIGQVVRHEGDKMGRKVIVVRVADEEYRRYEDEVRPVG